MLPTRVVGFDPEKGTILWHCDGLRGPRGNLAYSSPVMAGDICICVGGYQGPSLGFQLGGSGDITPQRKWLRETNPQSIGSGVVVDGYFYRPNAGPGTIECLDPATGEIKWTGRAEEFWGSIVYVAGHCFVTAQSGNVFVFKPTPEKFDLLYKNVMGEGSNATPAVSDGEFFIRTHKQLFCIAE
jgi:outer membrane protein assembly factor BamB